MKIIIYTLLLASFVYSFTLEVNVNNLRNTKGDVIISIYDNNESIPDEKLNKFMIQRKVKISNKKVKVVFKNLKQKKYAVNIIHDENRNGKIDKGYFMPIEGIGFSNHTNISLFNKPNFKNSSFLLDKDTNLEIKIIYF